MSFGGLHVRQLGDALGAEVCGLNFAKPLSSQEREFLRRAWTDHLVIVARDVQELSADAQIDFCRTFGEIGGRARPVEARHEPAGAPTDVMYVSNKRVGGRIIGSIPDGEMEFHIDQSYTQRPAKGTSLYAIEVPDEGGDTIFCNLYLAYETLPDDLRRAVDGRSALNVYGHGGYGIQTRNANELAAATRKHVHPIVCTHPDSGRKMLYVNRLMTASVEGLPENESEDLLFRLFAHQEQDAFRFIHKWRQGDLLLWDNRCTVHARTDFDPSKTRHLRRFSIQGHEMS
jgi:taurine dioxygenase